jgi:hypothetical protein
MQCYNVFLYRVHWGHTWGLQEIIELRYEIPTQNTNSNMQTPCTFEVTCNCPNLKQELHVRDFGQTNIYGLNANGYDDEVLHKFSM